MKKILLPMLILLIASMVTTNTNASTNSLFSDSTKQYRHEKFQFGIFYPLSTNGFDATEIINDYSVNLLLGISQGNEKAEFGGFMNINRGDVKGFQIAGFGNIVGGNLTAIQLAGFMNVGKNVTGIQIAGFMNIAANYTGLQFAGFSNITKDNVGIQGAGFLNISGNHTGILGAGFLNITKDLTGISLAGFSNISQDVTGIQGAGFFNVSRNMTGIQGAGFMNIARDVNGIQAAGFMNVAKKVDGMMVAGFLNIADSCETPIGIINLIKKGDKIITVWTNEMLTTNISFKSGGRKTYGMIGLSYNPIYKGLNWGGHAGIGMHTYVSDKVTFDTELLSSWLHDKDHGHRNTFYNTALKFQVVYALCNRVGIYAGPSVNYTETDNEDAYKAGLTIWKHEYSYDHRPFRNVHVGAVAGLQFKL